MLDDDENEEGKRIDDRSCSTIEFVEFEYEPIYLKFNCPSPAGGRYGFATFCDRSVNSEGELSRKEGMQIISVRNERHVRCSLARLRLQEYTSIARI